MSLAIIAAVADNGVIGKNNDLPWHLPEDLKRFKKLTIGHPCIMGRKTFDSIMSRLGKPLPDRTSIVISRQTDLDLPDDVELYHSIDDAIAAHANDALMVIGGEQIYQLTLPLADTLFMTHVHQTIPDGDAFFPPIDKTQWQVVEEEKHDGYDFFEYRKIA